MDGGFDEHALDPDQVRIGTAEREETSRLLAEHFAEGRLTTTEYEDRVDQALAARTRRELRVLFTDLPAPHPDFREPAGFGHGIAASKPETAVQPADVSPRSAVAAGILQIVFPFGTGRFYTGHTKLAVFQLLATVFTFGLAALWPFIDGILLLITGGTDPQGRRLR